MNVLVVDDEQSIRDSFELALEGIAELNLKLAENGVEAMKMVQGWPPALVFLDLKMPKMNGVETLRALRALYPDVPVYVVTAFAKEFTKELEQVRDDGIEFQLAAKPITLDQINEIVSAYL
ncbi:response regulator [Thiosulfativibrio zosterae]|uniref:Response regulator n=1 Tax=Thiosulfativibrio zosterae TaxID=2675053 RepID=A0A6F8PPZ8_9GAMM|nr:response regulator [Thiosulfativibrio zosterae]BBP44107.1 response regulator [Thiosulfativibrio zosterae]